MPGLALKLLLPDAAQHPGRDDITQKHAPFGDGTGRPRVMVGSGS